MNFTNIIFRYLLALASFFIFRYIDGRYNVSKWIMKTFKVNTMIKGIFFSSIVFLGIIMLAAAGKVLLGISDLILNYILWVAIGLIAALGAGVSTLLGNDKVVKR